MYFHLKIVELENTNILIYQVHDGQSGVEVRLDQDTVWLTQAQIMDFFESSKANIVTILSIFADPGNYLRRQLFGISGQFRSKAKA